MPSVPPTTLQMLAAGPLRSSLLPRKSRHEHGLEDSRPDAIADMEGGLGLGPQTLWASVFCKMRKPVTTFQDCHEGKV